MVTIQNLSMHSSVQFRREDTLLRATAQLHSRAFPSCFCHSSTSVYGLLRKIRLLPVGVPDRIYSHFFKLSTCPAHLNLPWFGHCNNSCSKTRITKFLISHFFRSSYYFSRIRFTTSSNTSSKKRSLFTATQKGVKL